MNLEQIDQLLSDWKKKIDIISQNIIDLQALPTYQKLSGDSGFPQIQLTGVTQTQITITLEVMNELFQYFDLLLTTIKKATELRKQILFSLGSEQKICEIEKILKGPSIQLSNIPTPLGMRQLLSPAETTKTITPEQLLLEMINGFQSVKDVVLAVDSAWLSLGEKLVNAEAEIVSLQKLASLLEVNTVNELFVVRQKIDTLRDRIETDPLGVNADFDRDICAIILRVKTNLEDLVKQQNQIKEKFVIAHQLLQQLKEIHHQAEIAFTESQEKILDHSILQSPLPTEQIEALGQWLTRLETKFAEGILNPVGIGIENWTIKIKEYISLEKKAYKANNAPLETRKELRGRLEALKIKAVARGLAEDATISALAENAKQVLYTRPTSLDQALKLVSEYEKKLNR